MDLFVIIPAPSLNSGHTATLQLRPNPRLPARTSDIRQTLAEMMFKNGRFEEKRI